jgi:transposase
VGITYAILHQIVDGFQVEHQKNQETAGLEPVTFNSGCHLQAEHFLG